MRYVGFLSLSLLLVGCSKNSADPGGAGGSGGSTSGKPEPSGGTGGSGGGQQGGAGGAPGDSDGTTGSVGGSGGSSGSDHGGTGGGQQGGAGGAPGDSDGTTGSLGGSGGSDDPDLEYVPIQNRSDGIWPELDQIQPRELGENEAKCRITHYSEEGGDFIERWTWQYAKDSGQTVRLTHDVPAGVEAEDFGGGTLVFDERGRFWSICYSNQPLESECYLFEDATPVNWDEPYEYADTCRGEKPEAGFQQIGQRCSLPSARDTECVPEQALQEQYWQFTEDGQLRRFLERHYLEYDCHIDGVLRVRGWVYDHSSGYREYYPNGSSASYLGRNFDGGGETRMTCDENGWLVELYEDQFGYFPLEGRQRLTQRYSFLGGDPLRPEQVDFEFDQRVSEYDIYFSCESPINAQGAFSAELAWSSDSVEIIPDDGTDGAGGAPPDAVTWTVELNPDAVSARLDEDGNVVEVYRSMVSNLRELGIRDLPPKWAGYYTYEGEGACRKGNPHLLLDGLLPYTETVEAEGLCGTGWVTVTGYEEICNPIEVEE